MNRLIRFSSDSRWFIDGDIFFAFTGSHFDARELIPSLRNRASLIITEKEAEGEGVIWRPDARWLHKQFIKAAARVYPVHAVGVTGTKGKSTIAWWLAKALNTGYMGTLGVVAGDLDIFLWTTTTPADALFNAYRLTGTDHWSVELSSIGLVEDRLPLPLEGLIWTTFDPEHLDYHKTMWEYYQAKRKAIYLLKKEGFLIIGEKVPKPDVKLPYYTYGRNGDFMMAERKEWDWHQEVTVGTPWGEVKICVPMPGEVFAENAVATVAAALLWKGKKLEGTLPPVKVRMNHVFMGEYEMVIDFAHTPESIDALLRTVTQRWKQDFCFAYGATGYEPEQKTYETIKVVKRYGVKAAVAIIKELDPEQSKAVLARYKEAGFFVGSSADVFQWCKQYKRWVVGGMRDAYERLKEVGLHET